MKTKVPRFMLSAVSSGSGKTLITCGILQALKERGWKPASFKCGPDYIDPMFHRTVIGTSSGNLDTFFVGDAGVRYLLARGAGQADLAVVEGVMGYYDGLGGTSEKASAYDVARAADIPAVLILNCKGASLSLAAQLKGFLEFRPDSHIRGVILNQMSQMLYPRMKKLIEEELKIRVYGYVPAAGELSLESRHLGLVLPEEVEELRDKLHRFALLLEKSLDLDGLLELASSAPDLESEVPDLPDPLNTERPPVVAVARDRAFCFLYEENLSLLRELGAELVFFSPIEDRELPRADGLLLCGGYPELHLPELSGNLSMRKAIRSAIDGGMPCLAECGGFMYLMEEMEDMEGRTWPTAGVFSGKAFRTDRLGRFGYITLKAGDPGGEKKRRGPAAGMEGPVRGHEFHYFDTTDNGDVYHAEKPLQGRSWDCMRIKERCLAGFPHIYYYSDPAFPAAFLKECLDYRREQEKGGKAS